MIHHSVAAIFPMLDEPQLATFANDIAANGLLEPIVIDAEERILDGRNRFRACQRKRSPARPIRERTRHFQRHTHSAASRDEEGGGGE